MRSLCATKTVLTEWVTWKENALASFQLRLILQASLACSPDRLILSLNLRDGPPFTTSSESYCGMVCVVLPPLLFSVRITWFVCLQNRKTTSIVVYQWKEAKSLFKYSLSLLSPWRNNNTMHFYGTRWSISFGILPISLRQLGWLRLMTDGYPSGKLGRARMLKMTSHVAMFSTTVARRLRGIVAIRNFNFYSYYVLNHIIILLLADPQWYNLYVQCLFGL